MPFNTKCFTEVELKNSPCHAYMQANMHYRKHTRLVMQKHINGTVILVDLHFKKNQCPE